MSLPLLLTAGHSNRTSDEFLALLREHGVEAVADVRSQPVSRRLPHFSSGPLKSDLRKAGIDYVFLGEELGARRSEPECYVDGQARYERIATTASFLRGLDRLRRGLGSRRVALMCAEKDPLTCHRTVLICRHLRDECDILHLIDPETTETHAAAEKRLIAQLGLPSSPDLFRTMDDILADAYEIQGGKIAYRQEAGSKSDSSDEESLE